LDGIGLDGLENDQRGHGVFRTVHMGRKVSGKVEANRKVPMQAATRIAASRETEINAVRLQQSGPSAVRRRATTQAPAGVSAIKPIRQHSTHFNSGLCGHSALFAIVLAMRPEGAT
jgi:hypothetical protein